MQRNTELLDQCIQVRRLIRQLKGAVATALNHHTEEVLKRVLSYLVFTLHRSKDLVIQFGRGRYNAGVIDVP